MGMSRHNFAVYMYLKINGAWEKASENFTNFGATHLAAYSSLIELIQSDRDVCIYELFMWAETPEGEDYWRRLDHKMTSSKEYKEALKQFGPKTELYPEKYDNRASAWLE